MNFKTILVNLNCELQVSANSLLPPRRWHVRIRPTS